MTFDDYIKRVMKENEELLKALGSDFDEEGIPYWEKWGSEVKFDKEYPIDKTLLNTIE
jgi:hypothetical protein